jgi:PAS domain S-box-containing protein
VSAIAAACFWSAKLAFELLRLQLEPSPVWCPSGIALAALLVLGRSTWTGVFLGTFLFALSEEAPLFAAGIAATGNTLEAIAAERWLRRIEFHPSFKSLRDVLGFVALAVFLAPMINATINAVNGGLAEIFPWQNFGATWWQLWLGNAMGILVITPLLLTWLSRPLGQQNGWGAIVQKWQNLRFRRKTCEILVWAVLLVSISWFVFQCDRTNGIAYYPLEYLPFPLIVWAALRFGRRGTMLGSLVVSGIALAGVVRGGSPFLVKAGGNIPQAALFLQAFIGVMTITALVLAAAVAERQQIEDVLRKREASLENAQRIAQLGNWDLDIPVWQGDRCPTLHPNTTLHWSDELYRILGREPRSVAPSLEVLLQVVHPDDRPQLEQAIAQAREARSSYRLNYRICLPNGAERLVTEQVEIAATGMTGTVQDITDRKQAEEALRQSEARFRVVAETAACAFMVYQGNHFRYVNPATTVITGYSQAELLTLNFWDLAHPEFRDVVRQRGLARQQGEDIPSRYEIKILTKFGKERWVDFTAGVIEYAGQPAGMATAYDITDRKQAEAQLQQAANRERLLAEIALRIRRSLNLEEILNTTVAEVRRFLQADRVFIASFCHPKCSQIVAESVDLQWTSILGSSLEGDALIEIRSWYGSEGLEGKKQLRIMNDVDQVEKTPLMVELQQRCQLRAGIGVPIVLEGQLFGALVVNQCTQTREWQPFEIDLLEKLATQVEIAIQQGQLYRQVQTLAANLETQVEERTIELHQRMQELQQTNEVKDLLLHAVAHDLRTPVQGMLLVLNKLRRKCEAAVPVSSAVLDCMIQSSDHQLHLLNALLENHASDEPALMLYREPAQLGAIVQTTLQSLQSRQCSHQVNLVNHVPADLPPVMLDPNLLQEVLIHLITNAVKHNPPGITVTIAANPQPRHLHCTVSDTGAGIRPEQRDRLFELYVRGVDNQRLTGIGLGLHRCQQIIAAHGGEIGVTSQLGTGATFWFTLPLQQPDSGLPSGAQFA